LHKNKKFIPVDFNTSAELTNHFIGLTPKIIVDLRGEDISARTLLGKLSESDNVTVYAHGQY
jgi:hypothetical protein